MGIIADTEDAILAAATGALGATVRETGSVPGGWTLDTLRRALQFAPGVYVAFLGGPKGRADGYVSGRFVVYVVTKAPVEPVRRRGNAQVIGAYEIVELLLPALDGLAVSGVGSLSCARVANLFQDAMFELGGSVYAIEIDLPNMPFIDSAAAPSIDDFVTFDAVYDIAAGDGEPTANDHVTGLDQA